KLHRRGKKGFGSPVWLPWWSGAPDGGNVFYRRREDGELEPCVPTELATAAPEAIERVLAMLPVGRVAKAPRRDDRPAGRSTQSSGSEDAVWADWRRRALAALPIDTVYGEWLTGNAAGVGWLE